MYRNRHLNENRTEAPITAPIASSGRALSFNPTSYTRVRNADAATAGPASLEPGEPTWARTDAPSPIGVKRTEGSQRSNRADRMFGNLSVLA
jgi:hypothetical protein